MAANGTVLDESTRSGLTAHVDKITHPVVLRASLDGSPTAERMRALLDEVAALSPQVSVADDGDATRRPSFAIERAESDVAVSFAGLPLGHEFTSFVLALLQVGGHPPRLPDGVAEQIAALDVEGEFETFVSLSCQNCPDVVQALNTVSVLNPRIRHTMVDGAVFTEEAEARNVQSVPTVFRDGGVFEQGRVTVQQIVDMLDDGSAERRRTELEGKDTFDVLVVGGGPAGAAAAIYAARKGIRTGIVSERFGGQLLDTMGIENFISVPATKGPEMVTALETHVRDYDVDVMDLEVAAGLREAGGIVDVSLESGATLQARSVVVATGARWRQLGVPGEAEHRNRGVTYCPHCDGPLFAGKRVAVVGGGNSGVEAAIDLAGIAAHVTVVEFLDHLIADDVLQRKLRSLPNTDVILSAETTEVVGDGTAVEGLRYTDRTDGIEAKLDVEGVFVQIGLLPNTEWLADSLELSDRNEIVIDAAGRTSMPGVFAAGDCTTVPYKQIVISMGAGATASLSAFDHLIRTSAPA